MRPLNTFKLTSQSGGCLMWSVGDGESPYRSFWYYFQSSLIHSILRLFYQQAIGAQLLKPSCTLIYLYKTPIFGPIISVNWVYQLTGYKFSPIKWSYTGNVQKIVVVMYLNAQRHMVALSIQGMFFSCHGLILPFSLPISWHNFMFS